MQLYEAEWATWESPGTQNTDLAARVNLKLASWRRAYLTYEQDDLGQRVHGAIGNLPGAER